MSLTEVHQQSVYQTEYLNSLTLTGLLSHKLNIKLGTVVMLLQNMDPSCGHCSGTLWFVESVRDTLQLRLRLANILEIFCS